MGRKGECGGTAGGGRSGRKGNITYSRVIPKFLQKLADPESMRNPIDAKRPWSTGHMKEPEPRDGVDKQKKSERPRETCLQDEIEGLKAQGFNVLPEPQHTEEERNEADPNLGGRKATRGDDKLQVVGRIEKKSKRTTSAMVGKAFDMKNRNKLSFIDSDSEDE